MLWNILWLISMVGWWCRSGLICESFLYWIQWMVLIDGSCSWLISFLKNRYGMIGEKRLNERTILEDYQLWSQIDRNKCQWIPPLYSIRFLRLCRTPEIKRFPIVSMNSFQLYFDEILRFAISLHDFCFRCFRWSCRCFQSFQRR